jgi:hypothetical protein
MGSQKTLITSLRDQKMEARASVRYRFGTTAVFSWEDKAGGRLKGGGVTRDISVGGAYILSPTCPPTEIVILLEIFFTFSGNTRRPLRIATEGRVLRVEHPTDSRARGGFAVAGKGFEILDVGTEQN